MTWANGRGRRTPERTRQRVLARDHGICCECGKPGATEVDHRIPWHQGGRDVESNLAAIHAKPCHQTKTAREAAAARWKHKTRRPQEQHPGLTR